MSQRTSNLKLWLGVFAGCVGLFVAVLVVLQNQVATRVEFLVWSVEAPLFIILNLVLFLGFVGGYLIGRTTRR